MLGVLFRKPKFFKKTKKNLETLAELTKLYVIYGEPKEGGRRYYMISDIRKVSLEEAEFLTPNDIFDYDRSLALVLIKEDADKILKRLQEIKKGRINSKIHGKEVA